MALTITHLRKNARQLTLEFAGETLTFTYRPGEITPALGQEMADDETKLPVVLALTRAVTSWDLLDEDTMLPAPITAAVLMELPTAFLNGLLNAILADTLVGKL